MPRSRHDDRGLVEAASELMWCARRWAVIPHGEVVMADGGALTNRSSGPGLLDG